jgi:triosephosphate isomerase
MGIIIVNFKTYAEATGQKAVDLAKICEKVAHDTSTPIFVVVQNVDLFRVKSAVKIPVFAEHVDPISFGANTGKDLPEALLANGATGVLINHSEDSDHFINIEKSIRRSREIGLQTIVCAPTADSCAALANFHPDFLAVEPPELIGGDISVSKARPELISDTVRQVRKNYMNITVLCGAGIKDDEDVRIAQKLGCEGILLASGITKAKDPEKALKLLIKGFI